MKSIVLSTSLLSGCLAHLEAVIKQRLSAHFNPTEESANFTFPANKSAIAAKTQLVKTLHLNSLTEEEWFVLLLALAPHLQADYLDGIIQDNLPQAGDFPKLGGVRGKHNYRGFLSTGETALFLLAGSDLEKRFQVQQIFSQEHFFATKRILYLEDVAEGEPRMSGQIILSQEYVDLFTTGKVSRPRFSLTFPAELLETRMDWEDLVLPEETFLQIGELETWLRHNSTLMDGWGMRKKFKPGYRVLFHGPPGTGKTLAATLLGKRTGKEVYKIDLSMVVSKYIGETEKNLANLFAKAENKDWILFFDEADALFGKRTNVRDAHDKYANQEVSYLLQRVENFDGLVILATNFKSNLDDAFVRRFQSIIHFPLPKAGERLMIWQKGFPAAVSLGAKLQLTAIAQKYEISGAEIMNVVQYCCLRALDRQTNVIEEEDVVDGLRREFQKEGKIMR